MKTSHQLNLHHGVSYVMYVVISNYTWINYVCTSKTNQNCSLSLNFLIHSFSPFSNTIPIYMLYNLYLGLTKVY